MPRLYSAFAGLIGFSVVLLGFTAARREWYLVGTALVLLVIGAIGFLYTR